MDALNAILERRSVRVFKDEKIERGDIDYILKAGLAGPSACNRRPVEIIVIENKDTILSAICLTSACGGCRHFQGNKACSTILVMRRLRLH